MRKRWKKTFFVFVARTSLRSVRTVQDLGPIFSQYGPRAWLIRYIYRLSSTKEESAKECNKLRTKFSKLRYPKTLVDSSINKFSQEPDKEIHMVPSADPSCYIVLPFKDQRSADRVRKDIYSLEAKIDVNVKPVFTSRKL